MERQTVVYLYNEYNLYSVVKRIILTATWMKLLNIILSK